tara:strand:+ start:5711 stop:7273 length:1563 start_codon:yes stop_codon:yes gene_type:complete
MASIDLVSNLLPGVLSAEGRRQAAPAQPVGQSLLGGIPGLGAVAPAASQQKRNLAGLFGGLTGRDIDVRSPIEKINAQLAQSGVDINTSAGLLEAAKLANAAGLSQQALQLTSGATKLQQKELKTAAENQARNQLIEQATNLGLEAVATSLKGGADLKEPAIEIQKEQISKTKGLESRTGRRRLASVLNAPAEIMEGINSGFYDTYEEDDFMSILSGSSASTKAFTDNKGEQVILREAKDGKVFDNNKKQWVDPSELGLAPAILATEVKNVDAVNAFTKTVYEGELENYSDANANAREAVETLQRNFTISSFVNAGLNSGTFSSWENAFTASGVSLGLIDPGSDEAERLNNTKIYISQKGQDVANAITAFGAGTGLSDKDREFAEGMVGADPSKYTEENIRKLLAVEKMYSYMSINKFNNLVDEVVERNLLEVASGDAKDNFKVKAPSGFQMKTFEPVSGDPSRNIYQISPSEWVTRAGDPVKGQKVNAEGQLVLLVRKEGNTELRFNTATNTYQTFTSP